MAARKTATDDAAAVAARSVDGSDGTTWLKTFLVRGAGFDKPDHPIHAANAVGVAQEALNRGLHPRGVAELRSAEVVDHDRRGVPSVALTYAVACVPAVGDETPAETVTPAKAGRTGK